jgi:hypothetical protein
MRGGYRPGAGRKKGTKDSKPRATKPGKKSSKKALDPEKQKLKEMLSYDIKAKARFYNEFLSRVSKGEKLSIAEKKMMGQLAIELSANLTDDEKQKAEAENLTPLEYMLRVMNDPNEDKDMRARMAIAAAPFVHSRKGEGGGKKDERDQKAKAASSGKFAPSAPPLKVVK